MNLNDFCVFILTHGRPDHVITYNTLKKQNYTGEIYLIIDNEDKTADQYYKNYSNKVIMFDKSSIAKTFDEGDNFEDHRAIVYARNACCQIAKDCGFRYFLQLDDDYTDFRFKCDESKEPINKRDIKNLDNIFSMLLEFFKSIPAMSIAIAQGGDFLGGRYGNAIKHPRLRKCMNTFFCSTERPFKFVGRVNEDVNTYTSLGGRGGLFLTVPFVAIQQKATQHTPGGMTEMYLASGTYVKSFYTVMYNPSSVKIRMMSSRHRRLHHSIQWSQTVPVIIREHYQKV